MMDLESKENLKKNSANWQKMGLVSASLSQLDRIRKGTLKEESSATLNGMAGKSNLRSNFVTPKDAP